jgi:hypothetical protein
MSNNNSIGFEEPQCGRLIGISAKNFSEKVKIYCKHEISPGCLQINAVSLEGMGILGIMGRSP